MCSDKNCKDFKFMQPVKPEMDMWSKEPQPCFKRKQVPLCSDKSCQSTRCYKKKDQVKSVCSDKNCQETQNINMWSVKPSMDMQLPKPAVPYQYKRYVVTRTVNLQGVSRKGCPVRPVCDDITVNLPNICVMTRNIM